ncbi:MAG TPA: hypothetical protein PLS69_13490, partial [Terricaulis sp.]|nr:hypothetical protein [Terricaulis sp.]
QQLVHLVAEFARAARQFGRRALRIAAQLETRELDVAIEKVANIFSSDRRRFDSVAREMLPFSAGDSGFDADLYILHAVRMVRMVQGFTLAAQIPPFSPRHDVTREGLLDMALDLRFAELAEAVAEIFPVTSETPAEFANLAEPGPLAAQPGYPAIAREIAAPLKALDTSIKEITVAITHFYGAFG